MSLTQDNLMEIITQHGLLRHGHFLLSSGRHSAEYWEKFRLLEWPRVTELLCREIATKYQEHALRAIVGPTTGGALLAQEIARQLDTRCLIVEPAANKNGRELRRGYILNVGEPILIVDDLLTTGLSLRETLSAVEPYQPNILGIEVLIDRSGGEALTQFGVPSHALLTVFAQTYSVEECPLCASGVPLVKPGTRIEAKQG